MPSIIQVAMEQHVPPGMIEDETVREYLVQLLQDEDIYDDLDALVEAVQPFLDDSREVASALVQALAKNKKPTPSSSIIAPKPTTDMPAQPVVKLQDTSSPSTSSSEEEDNNNVKNNTKGAAKSHAAKRKEERRQKRQQKQSKIKKSPNEDEDINQVVARIQQASAHELNEMDDYSSAWKDAKEAGRVWGGRGFGGRGVNRGLGVHTTQKDAVVHALTLSYGGRDLLQETHLVISNGHRYGLMGPNGVGKSTLLRRIATGSVPGWPLHLTVRMVEQEVLGSQKTVVECMKAAKSTRGANRKKQELEEEVTALESLMENEDTPAEELETAANRLSEIYDQLEAMDTRVEDAATGAFSELDVQAAMILKGLQFKGSMLETPMNLLSGGWRMRLALAQALYSQPDILLLDEPTNHLDLSAIMFLEQFIVDNDMTVVVVSHDGHFLDAVCTDMIKFENCKLRYHVGDYTSFRDMEEQMWARNTSKADAVARKEKKAMEFIQKQRSMANSKHRDDNKQRQAAERQKKLGRIGLFSENGQKFKLLAEGNTKKGGSNRAGHIFGNYTNTRGMTSAFVSNEQVAFGEDRQLLNFKFPAAAPLKGGGNGPLITMEDCYFRYGTTPNEPWLLEDMSLNVSFGSRIAIVGKNGAGKSTLLKIMSEELHVNKGEFHSHQNLKVAHIAQHHIEHLGAFLEYTPVEYFMKQHNAQSEHEARQFLGGFGLVGPLALQLIGTLSGGQKARLAFATVMYSKPHVLILDEPTNHLDRDSLESLSEAVDKFQGAVVIVSHNQDFMSRCAKEMWTVKDGSVKVQVPDGEVTTFDDLFEEYKTGLRNEMKKPKVKI